MRRGRYHLVKSVVEVSGLVGIGTATLASLVFIGLYARDHEHKHQHDERMREDQNLLVPEKSYEEVRQDHSDDICTGVVASDGCIYYRCEC